MLTVSGQPLEAFETLADPEIVRRVLAGELELFELLMRRHNRRVYRAAWAIVRNSSEAEDVMQDAYVRAYEHLHQFKGDAQFSTWLTRIAVNEALARAKRGGRWQELSEDNEMTDVTTTPVMTDPEHSAAAAELRHLLHGAMEQLPDRQRLVFVLRDVEGFSTAETAQALSMTEENVKVVLHRARAGLRENLYSRAGAEAPRLLEFNLDRCDGVVNAVMTRLRHMHGG